MRSHITRFLQERRLSRRFNRLGLSRKSSGKPNCDAPHWGHRLLDSLKNSSLTLVFVTKEHSDRLSPPCEPTPRNFISYSDTVQPSSPSLRIAPDCSPSQDATARGFAYEMPLQLSCVVCRARFLHLAHRPHHRRSLLYFITT